jgi:ABC-type uncharacterized transport system permease subunit
VPSGESPQSAHAIGYPVVRIRYLAVLFGGACAGLGGAYLSIAYNPSWTENMSAGRGWIALALGRVRHVEALARAGGRVPVRRRHAGAVPGTGAGC